jgi:predicted Fe-Mo cluster-binding NifX family protein
MKLVITCQGETLEDRTEQRFGRCPTFLLVDTDTFDVEAIPNQSSSQTVGASIGAAKQLTHQQQVEAVITGQVGPNAAKILETAGIPVYVGARGTAREALKAYHSGHLSRKPARAARKGTRRHFGGGGMSRKHGSLSHTPAGKGGRTGGKVARIGPETDLRGTPPTSGFHAGAEPQARDDTQGDQRRRQRKKKNP